jgi:ubiquinone biosynthesis protein COQ9
MPSPRQVSLAHGRPIWEAGGFSSARDEGFSRYSRRATLATVLVSTLLYWLEDISPDNEESWAFLDRRIENGMRFGQLRGQLQGFLKGLPGAGFFRRPASPRSGAMPQK